uniref:Uncharacterized protein n=1 Tax=Cyprinus carpio TaxID=7962 RepID=A0A8C2HXJ2_CYPCA
LHQVFINVYDASFVCSWWVLSELSVTAGIGIGATLTAASDRLKGSYDRKVSGGLLVPVIAIPSIEAASEITPFKTGQVAINRSTDAMKYGFPFLSNIKKTAAWVRKQLSAEIITGAVYRKFCDFKEDDLVHLYHRSTNVDYKGSGFDRAMDDTFYLSNVSLQNPHLNQNAWNNLEKYCRSLIKHYQNVFVCTGPLYLPRMNLVHWHLETLNMTTGDVLIQHYILVCFSMFMTQKLK